MRGGRDCDEVCVGVCEVCMFVRVVSLFSNLFLLLFFFVFYVPLAATFLPFAFFCLGFFAPSQSFKISVKHGQLTRHSASSSHYYGIFWPTPACRISSAMAAKSDERLFISVVLRFSVFVCVLPRQSSPPFPGPLALSE